MQTIEHRGPHAASARLVTDNHFSRTWMGDRVDWEALWVSGKLVEKNRQIESDFPHQHLCAALEAATPQRTAMRMRSTQTDTTLSGFQQSLELQL